MFCRSCWWAKDDLRSCFAVRWKHPIMKTRRPPLPETPPGYFCVYFSPSLMRVPLSWEDLSGNRTELVMMIYWKRMKADWFLDHLLNLSSLTPFNIQGYSQSSFSAHLNIYWLFTCKPGAADDIRREAVTTLSLDMCPPCWTGLKQYLMPPSSTHFKHITFMISGECLNKDLDLTKTDEEVCVLIIVAAATKSNGPFGSDKDTSFCLIA